MDKILVTGGAGFIGSHLVEQLLTSGHHARDIRLLILPGDSLKNLPDRHFDVVWGDIRNSSAVNAAMQGVSVVYHLAAKTVVEGTGYSAYADVNVTGTQNLLDACRSRSVRKFIMFSSIAVYGLPAFVGNIVNWDESRPKHPAEPYGESKLEAEKRLVKFHLSTGLPYVIIRPTTVYGPRDHQGMNELFKAVKNHYYFRIGDGKNLMDYVFVKDLVSGATSAQTSKLTAGDYILGCGHPLTSDFISRTVAASLRTSILPISVPKSAAMAVSYPMWLAGRLIGFRSPLFPNRVRILTSNCYYNISKARKDIGYNPSTTFVKGAGLTAKWLIKNKIV